MNINMKRNDTELTIEIEGRLDTLSSPDLEEKLENVLDGVEKLIIDLSALEYISSAGLRVFVGASQEIEDQDGEMIIRNLTPPVKAVFEVTGFIDGFKIE